MSKFQLVRISIFHWATGNLAVILGDIMMIRKIKLKDMPQQGENVNILYRFSTE